MQMKAALVLALVVCSDPGVVALREAADLGVAGLVGGSASRRGGAGRSDDAAALAERSAVDLGAAHAAALGGGSALKRGGGGAADEATLAEQLRPGPPGLEDIPDVDINDFAATTLGEVLTQDAELLRQHLHSARGQARLLSLVARSTFFAPAHSLRRRASDRACAWYLKSYGTAADRLGYSVASAVRWAVEHPKTAAAGAAAAVGGTLFAVWYYKRSKAHNLAEGEQAAAEDAVGRVGGQPLGDRLAAAAELLRSGSADHTVLLAAQAQLLWAGLAGNCTLLGTPIDGVNFGTQPLGTAVLRIPPGRLEKLATMPMATAKEQYPLLSPITAQCGTHLPLRLAWNDPQTLVDQLVHLEVMQ